MLCHLSNTIPTVMYGDVASCCASVFQHLVQENWSDEEMLKRQRVLEQIWSIRVQAQPKIPIKHLYRDVKMVVHRQTSRYLGENNKLHIISQVRGRNEHRKKETRTMENIGQMNNTNENSWSTLGLNRLYYIDAGQILKVYSSNKTNMVLKMVVLKNRLVKHLEINLEAFILIEMWWVHLKLIMVVQRDRKIIFSQWPNNLKPCCADNLPDALIGFWLKWEIVSLFCKICGLNYRGSKRWSRLWYFNIRTLAQDGWFRI